MSTTSTSRSGQMAAPNEGQSPASIKGNTGQTFPNIPDILPHEKVFPIQIGSKLFRLSGASISSDAPSYFSQFFVREVREKEKENVTVMRTLYIDRDPETFKDISMHLQGYNIRPKDSRHFVKLFADAQFYGLPRLITLLFESEIFIEIGQKHFSIPRDIFSSPGDSPNFFTLGFAVFFSAPGEAFAGLTSGLLRPPPIAPPTVPTRSAEVFSELLHLLQGYPVHIRNDEHREALLRDCRYFHLRGLEQKLIRHRIDYDMKHGRKEILIRLEDVRQSGIEFSPDSSSSSAAAGSGWVYYARPFVDENSYLLVLELGEEGTTIDLRTMRADFHGQIKARMSSLFQVVANKMNLPVTQPLGLMMMAGGASSQPPSPANTPLSDDQVRVHITKDTSIVLDGQPYHWDDRQEGISIESEAAGYEEPLQAHTPSSNLLEKSGPDRRLASTPSVKSVNGSSPGAQQGHDSAVTTPRYDPGRSIPPRKRKRQESSEYSRSEEWLVSRGHWRVRVQRGNKAKGGFEAVLMAVKLECHTSELWRNSRRQFLV